jgi:hypothetical protein
VVNFALGAYLDIPFLALIVLAGVLEARRPRRGAAVMALLALAGLLRPEAWLLEGAYWLYLLPALEPRKRVAMGALAAAAPILWALGDLLIAHDPLHSLTGTRAGAERLGRVTGAENVPHTLTTYLGRMLKLPVLVGGLAAFAAALIWRDRRLAVPAALAALGVGSYTALGVAGLSQLDRYVLLPGVAIAVLFGYATVGWTRMSPGPLRTGWAVVGLSLLAWAAAYLPDRARGIESGNAAIERRSRAIEDLESLTSRPAVRQAVRRCRPLNVDRARPYLAYQLDRPPQEVEHSRRPDRGLYVGPATRGVAKDFLSPEHRERLRPPGFDKLARNRSWIVYERGCDEIASVSQAGLRAPPHLPRRSPPR